MDINELNKVWLSEEKRAFTGWDFSYLTGRVSEQKLPWDYRAIILSYMSSSGVMLDMGTGGGEFLLTLSPVEGNTYATEAYPPIFELSKRVLSGHGIEVRQVFNDEQLPFDDGFFDLIINRHESFCADEVFRLLKPGGIFVTQQVGGQNNKRLSKLVLGTESRRTLPSFSLQSTMDEWVGSGFAIINGMESFPLQKFYDIGALVYFAKIIEWEFPGFSVEACFDNLCLLQQDIEKNGYVPSDQHRFFVVSSK
jgi:SAM-dependent methyltransferase